MSNDKPLAGLRALMVSPTYGPVDPDCAKKLRMSMMSAASQGVEWVGDASPDRQPYSFARNVAASVARQYPKTADGIMWVDSDIVCKPESISRLLVAMRYAEAEFMTGVYHARMAPYLPQLYHYVAERNGYLQAITYPKDTIISIDGCGFGFAWTSFKLINAIADSPNFNTAQGWFPDRRDIGGFGEDLSFCDQARLLEPRLQLYVDTGVQVGHTGNPSVVWEEQFRAQNITLDSPIIKRTVKADWANNSHVTEVVD